jgi:ribonuclease HI
MLNEIILRTDGGIREGKMACAWIAFDPEEPRAIIFQGSKKCGKKGTSNIAEYRGLISGLIEALKTGVEIVHIIVDSQLIVKQVTDAAKTNNVELLKHKNKVSQLLEKFKSYTIKWEGREHNKLADELVDKVFGGKKKNVKK